MNKDPYKHLRQIIQQPMPHTEEARRLMEAFIRAYLKDSGII